MPIVPHGAHRDGVDASCMRTCLIDPLPTAPPDAQHTVVHAGPHVLLVSRDKQATQRVTTAIELSTHPTRTRIASSEPAGVAAGSGVTGVAA